ncbi:MAG: Holliday junction branch migration protein RuvA [Muribaculaceae bacterium]|nr:Holliday junction branch migration protein RuvA [Muribaculaceae bacterium]
MLDYISGTVAELNPAFVVIDNHGMGYMINISLTTYDAIARLGKDEVVRLYVHEAIREDAHVLFGFATKRERDLFLLLIGVSGVGPNTARMILSSATAEQLENAIATGNVGMLKAVKGVGAKTAQRIIVDLKDKIKVGDAALLHQDAGAAVGEVFGEAQAALVMLGFTQQQSGKALKKLLQQQPALTVEQAIKQALKMM